MSAAANVSRFPLILYKRILRLHYGLPTEAKLMGDEYAKEEFRLHKNVPSEQANIFLREWTVSLHICRPILRSRFLQDYCSQLSKQLSNRGIAKGTSVGTSLKPELLDGFTDQQIRQLYELKVESDNWRGTESRE